MPPVFNVYLHPTARPAKFSGEYELMSFGLADEEILPRLCDPSPFIEATCLWTVPGDTKDSRFVTKRVQIVLPKSAIQRIERCHLTIMDAVLA